MEPIGVAKTQFASERGNGPLLRLEFGNLARLGHEENAVVDEVCLCDEVDHFLKSVNAA